MRRITAIALSIIIIITYAPGAQYCEYQGRWLTSTPDINENHPEPNRVIFCASHHAKKVEHSSKLSKKT